MEDYILIKEYREDIEIRKSFSALAQETFDLDFEDWFKKDLCNENYINYSYAFKGKVVGNVSVNLFDLVINGKIYKSIQLGTVMCDKAHRNKGLIRRLMNEVFKDWEEKVDLIYLYANDTVLDFYPKFGFKKKEETLFQIDGQDINQKITSIRKLNLDNNEEFELLDRLCKGRVPVSNKLGVINDLWPLKVYCTYMFRNSLYYLANEDIIIVMDKKDDTINLFDIISKNSFILDDILEKITSGGEKKINIDFVPELRKYSTEKKVKIDEDDTLFIKEYGVNLKEEVLFPTTSHT